MKIFNKKAKFEYELTGEGVEAGISLKGTEAKAIREGRGDLSNSFVRITETEAFLVNANIPAVGMAGYDPLRTRKLLLHKSEILSLLTKTKQKNKSCALAMSMESLRTRGQSRGSSALSLLSTSNSVPRAQYSNTLQRL